MGALLVFWLIFAVIVAVAAHGRGRSSVGWFLIAILISPLLALIAVLVMTPTEPREPCPQCGEQVPLIARLCRYCGYEF